MRLGDLDALKEVIRDNPYLMKNLNDDNDDCWKSFKKWMEQR